MLKLSHSLFWILNIQFLIVVSSQYVSEKRNDSCTPTTKGLPACNLDKAFCGYYSSKSMDDGKLQWKSVASEEGKVGNSPGIDSHWQPKKGKRGKFASLTVRDPSVPKGSKARLDGLITGNSIKAACLEIYYATTSGSGVPTITIYNALRNGNFLHEIGKIQDDTKGKWKIARFHSCVSTQSMISFVSEKMGENSYVGLDYLFITNSTMDCPSDEEPDSKSIISSTSVQTSSPTTSTKHATPVTTTITPTSTIKSTSPITTTATPTSTVKSTSPNPRTATPTTTIKSTSPITTTATPTITTKPTSTTTTITSITKPASTLTTSSINVTPTTASSSTSTKTNKNKKLTTDKSTTSTITASTSADSKSTNPTTSNNKTTTTKTTTKTNTIKPITTTKTTTKEHTISTTTNTERSSSGHTPSTTIKPITNAKTSTTNSNKSTIMTLIVINKVTTTKSTKPTINNEVTTTKATKPNATPTTYSKSTATQTTSHTPTADKDIGITALKQTKSVNPPTPTTPTNSNQGLSTSSGNTMTNFPTTHGQGHKGVNNTIPSTLKPASPTNLNVPPPTSPSPPHHQTSQVPHGSRDKNKSGSLSSSATTVLIVVGAILAMIVVVVIFVIILRRREQKGQGQFNYPVDDKFVFDVKGDRLSNSSDYQMKRISMDP